MVISIQITRLDFWFLPFSESNEHFSTQKDECIKTVILKLL